MGEAEQSFSEEGDGEDETADSAAEEEEEEEETRITGRRRNIINKNKMTDYILSIIFFFLGNRSKIQLK